MMPAPTCPACGTDARLMFGSDACPDRPELADAPVWSCVVCDDTYAECWPGTETAMGAPADAALREARTLVARHVERIVREAGHVELARDRITGFLASHLGADRAACDARLFDLEQCRAAYAALGRASYDDIRHWAATCRGPVKAKREALV